MKAEREKQILGRVEYVDFPELGIQHVAAKIDTGAYSPTLYCYSIKEKNGMLFFRSFHPVSPQAATEHCFKEYSRKKIKNSSGETEIRYVIKTIIEVGRRKIKTLVTLTNRSNMRYPVLLGRRVLKNRYLIDVSLIHTLATA